MTTAESTALADALSRQIDQVLGPLVSGRRCALVGFPRGSNPGDSAIWLGELEALRRAGAAVVHECHEWTYEPSLLRKSLGEGTVLLQGGGSLGDLWPDEQRFRERVIADLVDLPLVQLPQSVLFREPGALERARTIFNGHPDLTVAVRDRRSLELLQAEFDKPPILCPDMALSLGALSRARPATTDILWLSRADLESGGESVLRSPDVEIVDWDQRVPALVRGLKPLLGPSLRRSRWLRAQLSGSVSGRLDAIAGRRLAYAIDVLSRGRVLITDRLHGHILGLMLGIPHVLLGDRYGKVRAFYETWTAESALAAWAESPEDALEQARALLGQAG